MQSGFPVSCTRLARSFPVFARQTRRARILSRKTRKNEWFAWNDNDFFETRKHGQEIKFVTAVSAMCAGLMNNGDNFGYLSALSVLRMLDACDNYNSKGCPILSCPNERVPLGVWKFMWTEGFTGMLAPGLSLVKSNVTTRMIQI